MVDELCTNVTLRGPYMLASEACRKAFAALLQERGVCTLPPSYHTLAHYAFLRILP
jgi:hypothetical protein